MFLEPESSLNESNDSERDCLSPSFKASVLPQDAMMRTIQINYTHAISMNTTTRHLISEIISEEFYLVLLLRPEI